MNKIALAAALGLLLLFTYLTAIRPAYAFAYALSLLFVVAWVWPRLAIRGISLARRLDPGTPPSNRLRALHGVTPGGFT